MNILVVEDDEKLNKIICSYLSRNNFHSTPCLNPKEAFDSMKSNIYDLIISDVMMPEISGFEFVEEIRKRNLLIPILFVTALDDFNSKKIGFNVGIDDYMTKPIDMDELILRVNALLRRSQLQIQNKLQIGSLIMYKDEMSAFVNNIQKNITPKEFNILYKMLCSPKKIFTRSALTDDLWDLGNESTLRSIDVYITKLRKEFSDCDSFDIVTVHGFGYKAVLK